MNAYSLHISTSSRLGASAALLNLLQAQWHLIEVQLLAVIGEVTLFMEYLIGDLYLFVSYLFRFSMRFGTNA